MKHSLTHFITFSSGLDTFPEFVVVSKVDGVNVEYCDSDNKRPEPRQDWVKTLNKNDPEHLERHVQVCVGINEMLKALTGDVQQHFNQTGGIVNFYLYYLVYLYSLVSFFIHLHWYLHL